MSEEMLDRARRVWEASNRRDPEAVMEAMEPIDPDIEWVPPAIMPEQRPYRGREAVKGRIATLMENPGEGQLEELIQTGERIFTRVHLKGTGEKSSVPFEGDLYQVFTTREDGATIMRIENFFDRATALEAAGLSESSG